MDAILAGKINEIAYFTKGGQADLRNWLYTLHEGKAAYFDGSDDAVTAMVGQLSRETQNNDFMLDGNIIALRRTGDAALTRVAQGLETERQRRWDNGGAQRAAMADAAAFDIVKYGLLLPMSIGAAPVLVVEGAAIAGTGSAFAAFRGAMYMTAGTEMGTRGIGEYFGGTRGILSTGINHVTGTGGGDRWGVGDVVTTTAEAWTVGEGVIQLGRAGLSRLRGPLGGPTKVYGVDPAFRAIDVQRGLIKNGAYRLNPSARNLNDLLDSYGKIGGKTFGGNYMYVVNLDGNIIIGTRMGTSMPHPTLIGGKDPQVLAAGIVDIRAGQVYSVSNASGHFKPGVESLEVTRQAFSRLPSNAFKRDFQGYLPYTAPPPPRKR